MERAYFGSKVISSEFLSTLVASIFGVLTMSGIIAPDDTQPLTELAVQAIGGIVALGTIVSYIYSRTELKKTQITADINAKG